MGVLMTYITMINLLLRDFNFLCKIITLNQKNYSQMTKTYKVKRTNGSKKPYVAVTRYKE